MGVESPRSSGPTRARAAGPLALAVAGVGAAALVARLGAGTVVPFACPFRALTGLDCPFCGATRAAGELAGGHLLRAVDLNVLTTVGLVALLAVLLAGAARPLTGRAPLRWSLDPRLTRLLVAAVAVFWVVRNLPGPTGVLAS